MPPVDSTDDSESSTDDSESSTDDIQAIYLIIIGVVMGFSWWSRNCTFHEE